MWLFATALEHPGVAFRDGLPLGRISFKDFDNRFKTAWPPIPPKLVSRAMGLIDMNGVLISVLILMAHLNLTPNFSFPA